ncbi:MAG: hypothetical protein J6Y23_11910 [Prevotella sp.]|nr:hypothetical protein [Prevotella sp.]
MKKNVFILFAALLALATSSKATCQNDPIELQSTILDPTSQNDGQHKGSVPIPEVALDNHTLYFITPCDGYLLNIVDVNNVLVYSLVIPTGATSLVIPSTFSGEYELQIINGNYLFYGTIILP